MRMRPTKIGQGFVGRGRPIERVGWKGLRQIESGAGAVCLKLRRDGVSGPRSGHGPGVALRGIENNGEPPNPAQRPARPWRLRERLLRWGAVSSTSHERPSSESSPLELQQVHVRGTPRAMGRALGEALRGSVRAFVAGRLDSAVAYMKERGRGSLREFLGAGHACLQIAESWDPLGIDEHLGIAEGAGVPAATLYAAANFTDVRDVVVLPPPPEDEGCTAFMIPRQLSSDGQIVAGQTWDLTPRDLEFIVAVRRTPRDAPETWSVTCAGCLSLIGMNETGLSVGTTNIKVLAARPGVGYLSLIHRALAAPSRGEARDVVVGAPRAAAHTYWIVDRGGGLEVEASASEAFVRTLGDEPLARTNHCIAPKLQSRQGESTSSSSRVRLARVRQLLKAGSHDRRSLRKVFADRSDGTDSINRYPEDGQGIATNACVLAWPEKGELWACRGPADRGKWQRLAFDEA